MNRRITLAAALAAACAAGAVLAAGMEVGQKDKEFTVKKLTVKVGDSVSFPNLDPFFHNVFSLSPAKTFDLGSYAKGETRSITFDKAGNIEVECAIHPSMKMVIEVK